MKRSIATAAAAVALGTCVLLGAHAAFAQDARRPTGDGRPTGAARPVGAARSGSVRPASASPTSPSTVATPVTPTEPSARVPRVVLYGDSLAAESEALFLDAMAARGLGDVTTRTFGGTAICDWLDEMAGDALTLRPTAVVVEFSGNALTPCMTGPDGRSLGETRDAYEQRYRDDALAVVRIFTGIGARVHFVSAPITRTAQERRDPKADWVNTMYATLAAALPGVEYVDAGAAVLRGGSWTEVLPCLPDEPCTGGRDQTGVPVNVVRAPDGGHFCPGAPDSTRGVAQSCPVWSSGAFRYATAMADGVVAGG